ncbi:serine/threonine-protein kinase [Haliangium sp. UPWRP_2]|uniref:serine/threonine-protein kinase n=1 Tax=Haliangium sp. UPWRP_2 TaxID=1931276 RepID=UPI001E46017F|nr:serine/threonine-protein kinase [Haliangium sp. UPWRP_2]
MQYSKLGDYEIVRLIGQGGMGAVYEGLNPLIGRSVAIKVLLPEYANLDEVVRRFFNEAKAVNAIKHPGVVQVSDVGTATDGSLFLVMELLEGHTLSQRMQQSGGRLSQDETLTICCQLAGVLSAAHAKNIVHRDLKPGNVMVVPDLAGPGGERVKLLDFGIAKLGAEHLQGEDIKTRTGQTLGTAAYMSPEQCMGDQVISGQSDVYSLGVVMVRLLCGRLPFISTAGEMALGMMHLNKPPPLVSEFAPTVSGWLVDLVGRMLAKTPSARPTMAQIAAELQERLPVRPSSRSSIPAIKPEPGAVVYQEALEPTEDAAGDADTRGLPPSVSGPAGARDPSLASGVPVALESRQSGAGTITRATGQGGLPLKQPTRFRPLWLGLGGFALLASLRGGLWLLSASPVAAPSQPAAAPAATAGAGPQDAGRSAPSVGPAAQPSPASGGPTAAGLPGKPAGPAPAGSGGGPVDSDGESRRASQESPRAAGTPAADKSPRRGGSGKRADRKHDSKTRRAAGGTATPILD